MRRARRALSGVLAAAAVIAGASSAHADGTILFARGAAILQQDDEGRGAPVTIAHLPDDATEVRALEPTRDGGLVVVDLGGWSAWIVSRGPNAPAELRGGPCLGRARPSPRGDLVVCAGPHGPTLVTTERSEVVVLPGALEESSFRGPSGVDLVGLALDGVIGLDRRRPTERERLARPGVRAPFLPAPDGTRAVGVFGTGTRARVRVFPLDGTGIARQLGGPGLPTVWSWDSSWVIFEEGILPGQELDDGDDDEGGEAAFIEGAGAEKFLLSAPRKRGKGKHKGRSRGRSRSRQRLRRPPPPPPVPLTRACVARASGGEVKCWDGFRGLAFSPDSTRVLLKKDRDLYVGTIAGVRPAPPVKIISDVDGAATWVPAPIAGPVASP